MRILANSLICALFVTSGAKAADPPPPAPAPGSPGIYLSASQLATVMTSAMGTGTDPALAQIANTNQYFINEVHRTKAAPAYVHPGWTEVHIILGGSGVLVTGGTVKGDGKAKTIAGGTSQKVSKGDVIIVPADTPHQYTAIDGTLDAIEVRFIAPSAGAHP